MTSSCSAATDGSRRSSPRSGGYAAEAEAERICSNLGLPTRVLDQPLRTLSGGQRRRIELARILFSDAQTLLLDEPTNHLDADSIVWLRDYLRSYAGGLIVISHDVDLLDHVVNKVFHLDANRAALDLYNVGWKAYLQQREVDERRRHRERANAEKKAAALMQQADKMRAKATKAVAAQNMARRAERLLAGVEAERQGDRVAKIGSPSRRRAGGCRSPRKVCRRATARSRCSSTSTWRSTEAVASSYSDSTAQARRRCCVSCRGRERRTPARSSPDTG